LLCISIINFDFFTACYHKTRFICEDSEILLKEVLERKEVEEDYDEPEESTSVKTTLVTTTSQKTVQTTVKAIEVKAKKEEKQTEAKKQNFLRKKIFSDDEKKLSEKKIEVRDTTPTVEVHPKEEIKENEFNEAETVELEQDSQIEEIETTTVEATTTTTSRPVRGRGRGRGTPRRRTQ
jgi:hypothetical protein